MSFGKESYSYNLSDIEKTSKVAKALSSTVRLEILLNFLISMEVASKRFQRSLIFLLVVIVRLAELPLVVWLGIVIM